MSDFELVNKSFKRCGTSDGFYDTFYDLFLSKSDEIAPFFSGTDFKKQKKLLKATITTMIRFPLDHRGTQTTLAMVAETHKPDGYNIEPELYALWLDSLCETVKEHDPDITSELENQWRNYMQAAINIILSKYE
jgi:truncated hemoglobin YjbI